MSEPLTRLLLVEDESLLASAVRRHLERAGHEVRVASDLRSAREHLNGAGVGLVLLDMRLPDGSGMELLEQLSAPADPLDAGHPAVIVMTAFGGLEDAVAAMRAGADDYLRKPVDMDELSLNIQRVLAQRETQRQLAASRSRERGTGNSDAAADYLGNSDAAVALREQLTRIARLGGAPEPPNVLVLGETGTGKGLLARALHARSERAAQPFVHVDCTALPADLVESELFGHRKGAFTGATQERTGLIEAAERGTVFLDEIGELPLETQSKLLAVLERRLVRRVGSSNEARVDAWFIAATNRELEQEIEGGRFRADLYYRLKVLTLESPSLRERAEDVLVLAQHFVHMTAQRFGLTPPQISDEAANALQAHHWPGNVRELSHVMERAVLMGGGELLTPTLVSADAGLATATATAPTGDVTDVLRGVTLAEAEKLLIEEALKRTDGNVSQAARELGVTRMTLRYRLKQHGLAP